MKNFIKLFLIISLFIAFHAEAQVYDFEGNRYDTVRTGRQVWLKQNLKSRYYADGTPIDTGYFAYADDPANAEVYGYMYNYKAARRNDSTSDYLQGICPDNFHLPSDEEWKLMIITAGGRYTDYEPMSFYSGSTLFKDNINWNGINTSGLTIIPGGYKQLTIHADYIGLGKETMHWIGHKGGRAYRFNNTDIIQPYTFPAIHPSNHYYAYYCRCVMNDTTTNIENAQKQEIKINVYPNPATNHLFISGITVQVREVNLYNALGQEIAVNKTIEPGLINLDVSRLKKGIYILMIKAGNEVISRKVLKE